MTAASGAERPAAGRTTRPAASRPPGVLRTWRVEAVKLAAQWPARAALAVCLLGPLAFGLLLQLSNNVPADTIFGRWVHDTAMAIPLVALGFSGSWGFPLVVAVVAGDVLSGEDHHHTWKTVLTRSTTRGAIFGGKLLAVAGYALAAMAVLTGSALLAGELFGGSEPLIGLSGQTLGGGSALGRTALAWAAAVPAVLAFGAVALLVSALTRNTLAGIAVPVLLGLAGQLLTLVDGAQGLSAALPSAAFTAWRGLFTEPASLRPLLGAEIAAVVWCVAATVLAWMVVRRRDVTS